MSLVCIIFCVVIFFWLLLPSLLPLGSSPSPGLDAKVLANVAKAKHAEIAIFSSSEAQGRGPTLWE